MDYFQKIKIYGSNTNIRLNGSTIKYPAETSVLALPDISTFEIEVLGIYAGIKTKDETKTFWNGAELTISNAKITFSPQSVPINFPSERVSIETFYGYNTIRKKYKWIDLSDYTIMPEGAVDGTVIAVNIEGYSIADNGDGTKDIRFTLTERG